MTIVLSLFRGISRLFFSGAIGRLCFVIVALPGHLPLYFDMNIKIFCKPCLSFV